MFTHTGEDFVGGVLSGWTAGLAGDHEGVDESLAPTQGTGSSRGRNTVKLTC